MTQEETLAGRAEQVLQDCWPDRLAGRSFHVLGVHVVAATLFLAGAVSLALLAPAHRGVSLLMASALVGAYALGSRVRIAVGAGYAVPTQLALVPMLVILAPAVVPLLVAAGLVLSSLMDQVAGRRLAFRPLLVAVGDASYALGPAVVFVAFGAPDAGSRLLIASVFAAAAQFACDFVTSAARERGIRGLPAEQQLAVLMQVWGVDLLLWPVALVITEAIVQVGWNVLGLVPLLLLLDKLVRERNLRLKQGQERLTELNAARDRMEQAVRRVGQAFTSGHDLDALMSTVLKTAMDATGATVGHFEMTRPGCNPCAVDFAADRRLVVDETVDGRPEPRWLEEVAVEATDDVTGRLVVTSPRTLTDNDRALLRFLVEQAVLAESHINRVHRLDEEAQTDELTGLANFRRLHSFLDDGVKNHVRHQQPLSLILLDLDRFKAVNDTFGHQVGDLLLRSVASALRDNARAGDLAARQGGEELALVLPDTGLAGALAVATRVAAAIRERPLRVSPTEAIRVTASFGVATLGLHARDKTGLIRAADDALYTAKRLGRDQVRAAGKQQDQQPARDAQPAGDAQPADRMHGGDERAGHGREADRDRELDDQHAEPDTRPPLAQRGPFQGARAPSEVPLASASSETKRPAEGPIVSA